MRHLIESQELMVRMAGKYKILSCQYDNGRWSQALGIRLGVDKDIMFLMPCESCMDSLVAFFTEKILRSPQSLELEGVFSIEYIDADTVRLRKSPEKEVSHD